MGKKTTLSAIEVWLRGEGKPFHLVSGQSYSGNKIKIEWECSLGHRWMSSWNRIQQGNGCPHCAGCAPLTVAQIESWLKSNGKPFRLRPGQEIQGNKSKLWWECDQSHIWQTKWNCIQQGYSCPYCSGKARMTLERILEWTEDEGKPFHLVPGQIYTNCHIKMEWECDSGHHWWAHWNHIQQGNGCPSCRQKTEGFVGKLLQEKCGKDAVIPQFVLENVPLEIRVSGKTWVDYYVPVLNLVVEYHGYQHFEFPNHWHNTRDRFEYQQVWDQWLRDYCASSNTKLIEVSYLELDPKTFLQELLIEYFH